MTPGAKRTGGRKPLRWLLLAALGLFLIGASLAAAFFSSGRWSLTFADERQDQELSLSSQVVWEGATYERDPNVVPVLFIGTDQDTGRTAPGYNGQADALILMGIDTAEGDVTCISLSRNAKTQIEAFDPVTRESEGLQEDYLCLAYSYGGTDRHSGTLCCDAVSRMLGVGVGAYLILDMSGVGALADALGGVELTAIEDVFKTDIKQGQEVTLQGQSALEYVWQRDERDDYSAAGRLARQAQFARAFASQALAEAQSDPAALMELWDVVQEHSKTNLSTNELAFLLASVAANGASGTDGVEMLTIPGELQPVPGRMSQFITDEAAAQEMMLEVFYREVR